MLVYFDEREDAVLDQKGRYHPWGETTTGSGEVYVDFKRRPDLIAASLPDLQSVLETPAGRAIVDFLRVVNGPECAFETNDFAAKPIGANISNDRWPFEHRGRVVILYRDLVLNTREDLTNALIGELLKRLAQYEVGFDAACWGLARWPHLFTALEDSGKAAEGTCIYLMWWAWGNTDEEAAVNTARAFGALGSILSELSREKPWDRMPASP